MKLPVGFLLTSFAALAAGLSTNPDDIVFYLYPNASNSADTDILDYNDIHSVRRTRYDSGKSLIMYTGGFTQNCSAGLPIVNEYLAQNVQDDSNIVCVEWGSLAGNKDSIADLYSYNLSVPMTAANWVTVGQYPLYQRVVQNVPVVATRIKDLLFRLKDNHLFPLGSFASTHLIGCDVGAHVMGVVGKLVQAEDSSHKVIGRITGLDPAAPGFQDVDESLRLIYTDARFVDVLFTNPCGAGYCGNVGHANTYINGDSPLFIQSTCNVFPNSFNPFCSHLASISHFKQSIASTSLTVTRCNIFRYTQDFCGNLPLYRPISFGEKMPPTEWGMFYISNLTP